MRMQGRRESTNVRDIRGRSGAKVAGGLGLGGIVLVALFAYMTGGNPLNAVLNAMVGSGGSLAVGQGDGGGEEYVPTAEEQELATFSKQVLAGTEDVWGGIFAEMGRTYESPTLVLFTDAVQSGCGGASSRRGRSTVRRITACTSTCRFSATCGGSWGRTGTSPTPTS